MPLFLEYLNQQHPNITFTSEVDRDGKLPFLGVQIDLSRFQGKFNAPVYRKPTFIGLFTNVHTFISLTYERCLVSCLIHRHQVCFPFLQTNLFFFKVLKYLRSIVVYLFKCRWCSASYVGQTTRNYTLEYQSTWASLLSRFQNPFFLF